MHMHTHNRTRGLGYTAGWEAVIRVRASQGVSITDIFGNFFLRQSDLMVLPTVDWYAGVRRSLRALGACAPTSPAWVPEPPACVLVECSTHPHAMPL